MHRVVDALQHVQHAGDGLVELLARVGVLAAAQEVLERDSAVSQGEETVWSGGRGGSARIKDAFSVMAFDTIG